MDKISTCSNVKNHNKNAEDNTKNNPEKIQQNNTLISSKTDVMNNKSYYLSREKAYKLEKYGKEMLEWNRENMSYFPPISVILGKHSLTPEARKLMVDWMLEVFTVYECEPRTFELAVNIMDCYIYKTERKLEDDNIYLIGLASIYIASKMEEKVPMRLYHVVNYIGKNEFANKEIIEMEKEILMTIDFNFLSADTYDYLMTFFWDLKVKHEAKLIKYKLLDTVDRYMNLCVFLSELTHYDYDIITFDANYIAIVILTLGYDFLKHNGIIVKKKIKRYFRDWIYYLIYVLKLRAKEVSKVYNKLYKVFKFDVLKKQMKYDKKNGKDINDTSYLCKLFSKLNY
jgi:hypothetical protein